jgi:signal transduction histidine kinase
MAWRRTYNSRGYGLVLLLLLAVLVPSAFLVWFMNQAVQNERVAVRQKLLEAYRGNLALLQERLEGHLEQTATNLDALAENLSAPALFAREVRDGTADSVLCYDANGQILYPGTSLSNAESRDFTRSAEWSRAAGFETESPLDAAKAFSSIVETETNASAAAQALQAQVRCLIRAGDKEHALAVVKQAAADGRFRTATDGQGRLLMPNVELMVVEVLHQIESSESDSSRTQAVATILAQLRKEVLDYDSPMLSAQRRFLMGELARWQPSDELSRMFAAETLASRYAGEASGPPGPEQRGALRAAGVPGMYQFTSREARVALLFRAENLPARIAGWAPSLPGDVTLTLLSPGKESDKYLVSAPAGAAMPGWRLALSVNDQRLFEAAVNARIAVYVWCGALVLATVLVLAVLVLRLVRQQFALTQLRNDLVANVTHELKTPLSSMRLLVDTLLQSPQLNEQTAREYLQLIATENLRLSRLIDNFLTFSRIERNKYAFRFKTVQPAELLEAAAASVRERFNVPGCQFDVQRAERLPSLVADSDAMVTALVNLLDNAFKYTGDEKRIALSACATNGSVTFAVQDNGLGLSPRETKRIFNRFYQVDQRMSRTAGGCGLGLSIVKFIVAAHKGQVRVESETGKGSVFTLEVPVGNAGQNGQEV